MLYKQTHMVHKTKNSAHLEAKECSINTKAVIIYDTKTETYRVCRWDDIRIEKGEVYMAKYENGKLTTMDFIS